jgi:Ca2+-binding RTX toxin-like protein
VQALLPGSGSEEASVAEFYGTRGDDVLEAGFRSAGWVTFPSGVIGSTSRSDLIFADHGDDIVEAAAGNDFVYGEAGDDDLFGQAGHDFVNGGDGEDWLYGGAGNDELVGAAGDDQLFGDAGSDALDGGRGADALFGGLGDDEYVVRDDADRVREFAGEGYDFVISRAATHTLAGNLEALLLEGGARNGIGNAGANTIDGSGLDNGLNGGAGNDFVWGNAGHDRLIGGGGDDDLDGGAGRDLVRGQGGGDFLAGGLGADTLIGGAQADFFDFDFASESSPTSRDAIRVGDGAIAFQNPGLAHGDLIDVSGIDADRTTAADDAFLLGGGGLGRLLLVDTAAGTLVRGNISPASGWELAILIEDGAVRASAYTAADFLL